MNTIGAIEPVLTDGDGESQRVESLERLSYLVERKSVGLLHGQTQGTMRSLVTQLSERLSREGIQVAEIHLSGTNSSELPFLIAAELGLVVSSGPDTLQVWTAIQSYAESARRTESRFAFIFTGVELANDEIASAIDRTLNMLDGVIPCVFTTRGPVIGLMKTILSQYVWLRVDLDQMSQRESIQEFVSELRKHKSEFCLADEVAEAVHIATRGDAEKLKRLAELASLAAEADARVEIDSDTIRALAPELSPVL